MDPEMFSELVRTIAFNEMHPSESGGGSPTRDNTDFLSGVFASDLFPETAARSFTQEQGHGKKLHTGGLKEFYAHRDHSQLSFTSDFER